MTYRNVGLSLKGASLVEKRNKEQSDLEVWLDNHNHTLAFIRTIMSVIGITISTVILLRVFGLL